MASPQPLAHRPASAGDLPDVLLFMQLLWAVVHGFDRASKRMKRTLGVTGPQRLVLRVAGLYPDISAGDLAAILHVHPSTLTGVLQRLLARKLLTRIGDPRDGRRALFRLTAAGARVNGSMEGTVEAIVAAALESVSDRDRMATTRILERLAEQLNAEASHEPRGAGGRKRTPSSRRARA